MSQLAKFRCCDFNYLLAKKQDLFRRPYKMFWQGAVFRGRHKRFFGEVGGGNKVVCLKTRTLLTCLLGKKSDVVVFCIWGREFFFFLGGGSFLGEI